MARAAVGWPVKGSRGNLGLKTSLQEVWHGGVSLLEDGAEAILAREVGGVKKEEKEERDGGEEQMGEDSKEEGALPG